MRPLTSAFRFMRGMLEGDPLEQLGKILISLRHGPTLFELQRALFYHRYATAVLMAYRLGVFEALDAGPRPLSDLARICGMHPEAAASLVRILEAQNLVERTAHHELQLTAAAAAFLSHSSPTSMVPMLEVCETFAHCFPHLLEGTRGGAIAGELDIFDPLGRIDAILDGVNYYLDQAGRELLANTELPRIGPFIVGSMGVSFSALVLNRFPESRVTYGCLEHLVQRIPRVRRTYGVDTLRVEDMHSHGGEPDDDTWGEEAFDMVFLTKKMVLDPERGLGRKFAQKAYSVLNPGGLTIFWEAIHPDHHRSSVHQALESLFDLGVSPTAPLLTETGFQNTL
ncbi:MAG: hypothetical protein ACNA8W_00580, partial [Bradymonadaceae bacterium]